MIGERKLKQSEGFIDEHRTSLPPLKPAQYQYEEPQDNNVPVHYEEEQEFDTKNGTITGFMLNIPKNTDSNSFGNKLVHTHNLKISKKNKLNNLKERDHPKVKRNFFYNPEAAEFKYSSSQVKANKCKFITN